MTQHRYGAIKDVWIGYEWLLKSKLEELDHMAREMYKAMQLSGASKGAIDQFIPAAFADLWGRVAAEQEAAQCGKKSE